MGRSIGNPPDELTWSPDGKHLTYLDGGELIDLDPGTGKPHVLVSRAKLATLMRGQSLGDRTATIASATRWPATSGRRTQRTSCSTPTAGCGSTICATAQESRSALPALAPATIPSSRPTAKRSPSFATTASPCISLREPGTPAIVVAPSPNAAILNGEVDWVYEEELETRSNYFWSPDSTRLAYLQMNESEVPQYPIEDWIPTHALVDAQRYPQPGDPNPDVRVGVVNAWAARRCGSSFPFSPARITFPASAGPTARTLWIETLTRDHKHRDIYLADPDTGQSHPSPPVERRQVHRRQLRRLGAATADRAHQLG